MEIYIHICWCKFKPRKASVLSVSKVPGMFLNRRKSEQKNQSSHSIFHISILQNWRVLSQCKGRVCTPSEENLPKASQPHSEGSDSYSMQYPWFKELWQVVTATTGHRYLNHGFFWLLKVFRHHHISNCPSKFGQGEEAAELSDILFVLENKILFQGPLWTNLAAPSGYNEGHPLLWNFFQEEVQEASSELRTVLYREIKGTEITDVYLMLQKTSIDWMRNRGF